MTTDFEDDLDCTDLIADFADFFDFADLGITDFADDFDFTDFTADLEDAFFETDLVFTLAVFDSVSLFDFQIDFFEVSGLYFDLLDFLRSSG